MKTYLATLGRGKSGFSAVGQSAAGEAMRVDGVRGVVERNTLRYYLALQSRQLPSGWRQAVPHICSTRPPTTALTWYSRQGPSSLP